MLILFYWEELQIQQKSKVGHSTKKNYFFRGHEQGTRVLILLYWEELEIQQKSKVGHSTKKNIKHP